MIPVTERIEQLGGDRFVRDYQPVWESQLARDGFRLGADRLPVFMTIDETPASAQRLARTHLPHLTGALGKALDHSLATPALRRRVMASLQNEQVVRLLDVGRGPRVADLMGRYDTFLERRDGERVVPRVIEANFNNVEGSLYQHLALRGARALAAELGLSIVPAPTPLELLWQWMLARYRAYRTAPGPPTVGIAWDVGNRVKDVELPAAAELFARWSHEIGVEVVTGDVHALERTGRGWVLAGRPIDLLWKNTGPLYPAGLDELAFVDLPRTDPDELVVLSDVVGRLLGSKWLFEVLWNPETQRLFSAAELAAIELMVPWTAELHDGPSHHRDGSTIPDLLDWVSRNRDHLVLKPALGSHGDGVLVGPSATGGEWDEAIGRATSGEWIVMEYVAPERMVLPVADPGDGWRTTWQTELVDCNFYVYGGSRVGVPIRRAAGGPILNVAKDTSDGRPGGGMLISVPEGVHREVDTLTVARSAQAGPTPTSAVRSPAARGKSRRWGRLDG